VSYCPQCNVVRKYTSIRVDHCSRYGTWLSHLKSIVQHGYNVYQDYCCLCLESIDCKKKFGRLGTYNFNFMDSACNQCKIKKTSQNNSMRWQKILYDYKKNNFLE
jgi:hypothetical protein